MPTKLGAHVIRSCTGLGDYIAARPAVVKLVGDWGLASVVPAEVLVIGRKHQANYDAQHQHAQGMDPDEAAARFIEDQLDTYQANPAITYWEGHNEPVWNNLDEMDWYADFEIERMRLMAALNLKCVIGNFATGTPDLLLWEAFVAACKEAVKYEAILGLHEYSCPWMWWMTGKHQVDPTEDQGDEGWTTLRYRKVYRQYLEPAGVGWLPLVITETGIDPLVNPKPAGCDGGAWKNLGDYWRDHDGEPDKAAYYFEQLKWYDDELQKDDFVIGATVFTWGSYGSPWSDFDVAGSEVADLLTADAKLSPAVPFKYPTATGRRGAPREQYKRAYLLLPPGADVAWTVAAFKATWDDKRMTVGGSADDAGIGDLDARRVIAVNPGEWGGDLGEFFEQHYPGVTWTGIEAATPDELEAMLAQEPEPEDVPWSRDITYELARRTDYDAWAGTSLEHGWWQRDPRTQISGVCFHHTYGSHSPSALASHYVYNKTWTDDEGTVFTGHPSIPYTIWITETGEVLLCNPLTDGVWHNHAGHKNTWLSVGLAGMLNENMPSNAQLDAAARVAAWAIQSDMLPAITKTTQVTGHMDHYDTACPGWIASGVDRWKTKLFQRILSILGDVQEVRIGFNDWSPGQRDNGAEWIRNTGHGAQAIVYYPLYVINYLDAAGFDNHRHHFDARENAKAGMETWLNLRYSWSTDKGGRGTVPPGDQWDRGERHAFIETCVKVMLLAEQQGVTGVAIGNEYNNVREWPEGPDLTPAEIAAGYNAVRSRYYQRRKELGRTSDPLLMAVGAPDPFFGPGSDNSQWWREIMGAVTDVERIGLHGYVRGANPDLCRSQARFGNDPLRWQGLNYHLCITTMLDMLPERFARVPYHVSEFNHIWRTEQESEDIGWVGDERAAAVVQEAMAVLRERNTDPAATNRCVGLCLYRWSGDEWKLNRNDVVKNAVIKELER